MPFIMILNFEEVTCFNVNLLILFSFLNVRVFDELFRNTDVAFAMPIQNLTWDELGS